MPTNLDKALTLAALGVHVFPVGANKKPLTPNGFQAATTDPISVKALWHKREDALVGYWTGASGLCVLDVDVHRENGYDTLIWLSQYIPETADWGSTVSYETPSGGEHNVFRTGKALTPAAPYLKLSGIDRRSGGSYGIWYGEAPSQEEWDSMAEVPEWFAHGNQWRGGSTFSGSDFSGDIVEWIQALTEGVADSSLAVTAEHYGDVKDALGAIVRAATFEPERPGIQTALQYVMDSFLNSPVSSVAVEERAAKMLDLLRWWIPRMEEEFSEVQGGFEWVRSRDKAEVERVEAQKAFWELRPLLKHVETTARQTVLSPWALLGSLIQRALLEVPYDIPYYSALGPTSVNSLVGFVGVTGGGKSRTQRQLDEAFSMSGDGWRASVREAGSGEGLIDAYRVRTRDADGNPALDWTSYNHALLFGFDEVGSLTSRQGRQGTTIFEVMKSAESGSSLSRVLAGGNGSELPGGEYRFCMFINVQPAKAGALFDESAIAGGLPGRFLWMDTRNEKARAEHLPGPVTKFPVQRVIWDGKRAIRSLPEMDEAHLESQFAGHEGTRDEMDSHSVLTRAKVAVGLMVLDGRSALNSEDWEIAGLVMDHSNETRASMLATLKAAAAADTQRRGKAQGVANVAAKAVEERSHVQKVAVRITELRSKGLPDLGKGGVKQSLRSDQRPFWDEALELLAADST